MASFLIIGLGAALVLALILFLAQREEDILKRQRTPGGTLTAVWDGSERRQCPRYLCACAVRYHIHPRTQDEKPVQAHMWDISEGGCAVHLPERLMPGAHIAMELAGETSPTVLRAQGEVRWTRELPRRHPLAPRIFATGIKFLDTNNAALNALIARALEHAASEGKT